MKTSVVLTTYNGKKYIVELLDSLRMQTVKIDEVIILDDNSNDETALIINDYIKQYNLQEQLYDYYECDKTYKQQKFKYRLNEAIVMFNGLKSLGLLPKYFIYCFKPILSGLTPLFIKKLFKSKKYKKQLLER